MVNNMDFFTEYVENDMQLDLVTWSLITSKKQFYWEPNCKVSGITVDNER